MKAEISKKQVDLYFAIIERMKSYAQRENEMEMFKDVMVLEKCALQWLKKYSVIDERRGKAEHQLALVLPLKPKA